ncbi:MAG: FHIPEP family type III secretion protein [Myxococcales bacterium]|nr:FHIPEP family type III secretion protein [Myxococcales bacterium]MBL0193622.1 FHIPEP family type III secretion protein [Myxococcales bacterium]HQY63253.1 flagellar biosynthesis protein FlhA [Polyangiaceae bacterium]
MPPPTARRSRADGLLATVVLATIAMLVVVLPTWLLDGLLAANLALSVGVLVVVLYARERLTLEAFPSVLLLTTLFRLALNVSSSRLILLQGDAGAVIRAFGGFVVRGNVLVGAVIFVVLTIVQFVVIAKGAERIAEVGARFSLDSLPGKQLAIDAELRAGLLTAEEARAGRSLLARQSQFYGAMDGAMKFVKGDVIATVIIVGVNVVFGLVVGVLQHGLTAQQAAAKYVLLAVGDGLVSQVPALLLSTAAGVLVTRTASEGDGSLGDDLASQLLSSPRALATTGVFVLLLGLVPGLPLAPFLALSAALLLGARWVAARHQGPAGIASARRFVPVVAPLGVRAGPDAHAAVAAPLADALEALRDRFFRDLGVPLPPIPVTLAPELRPSEVVLEVHEVPAWRLDAPDTRGDALAALVSAVERVARARAPELLGLPEVHALLDALGERSPSATRVVPKPVPHALLLDVLRCLLAEHVPVRDLSAILEVLGSKAGREADPRVLADAIRAHQRRAMTFRLTRGAAELPVVLLDPLVEDTVRRGISKHGDAATLALPPAQARDVIAAVMRAIGEAREAGVPPIVVASPDVRRFLRGLLDVDAPDVPVVSHAELTPELSLTPLARAHLGGLG